jgi:hypothetical protein
MKKILTLTSMAFLVAMGSVQADETIANSAKSNVAVTKTKTKSKAKKQAKKERKATNDAASQSTDTTPGSVRTMQDELLAE